MIYKATQKYRGDGTTTRQMREAPEGAMYVWLNSCMDYPRELACSLGRHDLRIVSIEHCMRNPSILRGISHIVIDHAVDTSKLNGTELHVDFHRLVEYY